VLDGVAGVHFAVWAPNAAAVSVMGDWNGWSKAAQELRTHAGSGVWEGFIPGVVHGAAYKYHVKSRYEGYEVDKADPFAVYAEVSPRTGSRVWNLDYASGRSYVTPGASRRNAIDARLDPSCISLVASCPEEDDRRRLREIAPLLVEHIAHARASDVCCRSWASVLRFRAINPPATSPTSASAAADLMFLIDSLHQPHGVIRPCRRTSRPTSLASATSTARTSTSLAVAPGFHPDGRASSSTTVATGEELSAVSALFWIDKTTPSRLRFVGRGRVAPHTRARRRSGSRTITADARNLDAIDSAPAKERPRSTTASQKREHRRVDGGRCYRSGFTSGARLGMKWDMV
jgi:1,4-alpha-glucan branching enzyme